MTRAHMLRGSAGLVAGKLHPNNVHALVLTLDNRWVRRNISNFISLIFLFQTWLLGHGDWGGNQKYWTEQERNIYLHGFISRWIVSWLISHVFVYLFNTFARYVAVGSDDSSVRVLRYNEATAVKIGSNFMKFWLIINEYSGSANCGSITSLKFGPDNATLATATMSGALVWTKWCEGFDKCYSALWWMNSSG